MKIIKVFLIGVVFMLASILQKFASANEKLNAEELIESIENGTFGISQAEVERFGDLESAMKNLQGLASAVEKQDQNQAFQYIVQVHCNVMNTRLRENPININLNDIVHSEFGINELMKGGNGYSDLDISMAMLCDYDLEKIMHDEMDSNEAERILGKTSTSVLDEMIFYSRCNHVAESLGKKTQLMESIVLRDLGEIEIEIDSSKKLSQYFSRLSFSLNMNSVHEFTSNNITKSPMNFWDTVCVPYYGIASKNKTTAGVVSATEYNTETVFEILEPNTLRVVGPIGLGFADELGRVLDRNSNVSIVSLGSTGGSYLEGVAAGRVIRERGLHTTLYGNCDSSCGFAFVGGLLRFYDASEFKLGFHQFTVRSKPIEGDHLRIANLSVAKYLKEMGVQPEYYLTKMNSPTQGNIAHVDEDELIEYGVINISETLDCHAGINRMPKSDVFTERFGIQFDEETKFVVDGYRELYRINQETTLHSDEDVDEIFEVFDDLKMFYCLLFELEELHRGVVSAEVHSSALEAVSKLYDVLPWENMSDEEIDRAYEKNIAEVLKRLEKMNLPKASNLVTKRTESILDSR